MQQEMGTSLSISLTWGFLGNVCFPTCHLTVYLLLAVFFPKCQNK